MKNKSQLKVKRIFKRIINVRSWADWDRTRSFTDYLMKGFRKFFVPQQQTEGETFESAKTRLNLIDSEILARQ